jgi:hypothetical protein
MKPGGDGFEIVSGEYRSKNLSMGNPEGTLNGCAASQDYVVQTNFKVTATPPNFYWAGIVLRNQGGASPDENYYWVRVERLGTWRLIAGRRVGGSRFDIGNVNIIGVTLNTINTLKVQIQGTEIKAKWWGAFVDVTYDPADPGATEPIAWDLIINDGTFTSGKFGVEAMSQDFYFDNLSVSNAP